MVVLTDKNFRENLYPFTYTRHVADIRIGMLTIKEKWEMLLGEKVSLLETDKGVHIPASIIPTLENYKNIIAAAEKNIFLMETELIKIISFPWHIFQLNDFALRQDFTLCTKGKFTAKIDASNTLIGESNIFIEEGVAVKHCILNASTGPIYIAKGTQIMEGCMIRGPFYLGEHSVVKMGAKIYGATTIGPHCTVAGEIKNSILFEYSNKAHDGYLGDSVIGAWCNLGAGTSNSNVKNSGGNIGYVLEEDTQAIFAGDKAGLLMGDFSRAAINTSFNTGSVVGVCCNVFGEVMPSKHIKNFTWGVERYKYEKILEDISNWMKFKNKNLDTDTIYTLQALYGKV